MRLTVVVVVCAALACAGVAVVAQEKKAPSTPAKAATTAKTAPMSDDQLIKSAMSAAPAAIGKGATIVAMGADMKMRTIRNGTNGFTCMPDNPETPGPDPMCADQNAMAWLDAYLNKKDPPKDKVGFVYMLAGGTDASNTDPYAKEPTATNNWIKTGSHVMVVGAKGMMDGYPRGAKPDTTKPYVMWAGTPYEHLMLPVK
jgi:hypothetical protein